MLCLHIIIAFILDFLSTKWVEHILSRKERLYNEKKSIIIQEEKSGKSSRIRVESLAKPPELNLKKSPSNDCKLESQNSQQDLINDENIIT